MQETKLPLKEQAAGEERHGTAPPEPSEISRDAGAGNRPAVSANGAAVAPLEKTGTDATPRTGLLWKALIGIVLLGLLFAGGAWAFHAWSYGRTHVSTDDAQISGNLINISPT